MNGQGTIRLGDQTFLACQITDGQRLTILSRLQKSVPSPMDAYNALVTSPAWKAAPEKIREPLEAKLLAEAAGKQLAGQSIVDEATALGLLQRPEHCAFFAWVVFRPNHPGLSFGDVRALITEDNAAAVLAELVEGTGLKKSQATAGPVGSPSPSASTAAASTAT